MSQADTDQQGNSPSKRRGLGRGLNALFGDDEVDFNSGQEHLEQMDLNSVEDDAVSDRADRLVAGGGGILRRVLPIAQLSAGQFQPRQEFNEEALSDLAQSIREHGLIQPILVRPIASRDGEYEIVAGERRWRAAQMAQLHEVPVIIRELDDATTLELALIENLQRQDLNVLEEAQAIALLISQFGYTHEKAGQRMGKSRAYISNILRLMELEGSVRTLITEGKISAGHARALLPLSAMEQIDLARKVVALGSSVRQTEKMVAEALGRYKSAVEGSLHPERPHSDSRGEPKIHSRDHNAAHDSNNEYSSFTNSDEVDDQYLGRLDSSSEAKSEASISQQAKIASSKDVSTLALEREVSNLLGTEVGIDMYTHQSGMIKIYYANLDQLDEVLHRLSHNPGRLAIRG